MMWLERLNMRFLLRLLWLAFLLLSLIGCTAQTAKQGQQEFDVALLNATHVDTFISEENQTEEKILEKISFIIQNNEDFALDCDVLLSLNNKTHSSTKKGTVGLLRSKAQKEVSLTFEMPHGTADLSIASECTKP
jgi:hypothetical protein